MIYQTLNVPSNRGALGVQYSVDGGPIGRFAESVGAADFRSRVELGFFELAMVDQISILWMASRRNGFWDAQRQSLETLLIMLAARSKVA